MERVYWDESCNGPGDFLPTLQIEGATRCFRVKQELAFLVTILTSAEVYTLSKTVHI